MEIGRSGGLRVSEPWDDFGLNSYNLRLAVCNVTGSLQKRLTRGADDRKFAYMYFPQWAYRGAIQDVHRVFAYFHTRPLPNAAANRQGGHSPETGERFAHRWKQSLGRNAAGWR